MKFNFLPLAFFLLAIFFSCSKQEPSALIPTGNPAIVEQRSNDEILGLEDTPEDIDPGVDRCCLVTITSQTPQGVITYAFKNPDTQSFYSQRKIFIYDADYQGAPLYSYAWSTNHSFCQSFTAKVHLPSIVMNSLNNCKNNYYAEMHLQKKVNGIWYTCSKVKSNVYHLGTNICE